MVLSLHLYQLTIQSTILNLIRFDAIWCCGILVMQDSEHSHGIAQGGARLTDPYEQCFPGLCFSSKPHWIPLCSSLVACICEWVVDTSVNQCLLSGWVMGILTLQCLHYWCL